MSFEDTNFDDAARTQMVQLGAALYDRGLTPGRTGNLSVRTDDEIMITPTNACLGRLDPERLAVTSIDGEHRAGERPSKELVLHRALYRNHPTCTAVAHLHSTSAVAVSCLPGLRSDDALPPITPYFVMRVGRLPLIDYATPGSVELDRAGLEGVGALTLGADAQPRVARRGALARKRGRRGGGDRGDRAPVLALGGPLAGVPGRGGRGGAAPPLPPDRVGGTGGTTSYERDSDSWRVTIGCASNAKAGK